jgi:hypothetical protein
MFDKQELFEQYHQALHLGNLDAKEEIFKKVPTILAYVRKLERDVERETERADTAEAKLTVATPKKKRTPKLKAKAEVVEKVEEVEVPDELEDEEVSAVSQDEDYPF